MGKKSVILFFVFISFQLRSQWLLVNNVPTNKNLNSVRFASSNIAIAVGDSGTILKSIDGGNVWTAINYSKKNKLRSVTFTDSNTGYIAGDSGLILRTIDSGNTWSIMISGTTTNLYSLSFSGLTKGYVAGNNGGPLSGVLLRTLDAGITWTPCVVDDNRSLYTVYARDDNNVYAAGYVPTAFAPLFVSSNGNNFGNAAWSAIRYGSTFSSVFVPSKWNGFLVGMGSLRYVNVPSAPPNIWGWQGGQPGSGNALFFADTLSGYVVGDNGVIMHTSNKGDNWNYQYSPAGFKKLNCVHFDNILNGLIVGDSGVILKTNNAGIGLNERSLDMEKIDIYPNPVSDKVTIKLKDNAVPISYQIFNSIGILVQSDKLNQNEIEVSKFKPGLYFLRIIDRQGNEFTKRMVKE